MMGPNIYCNSEPAELNTQYDWSLIPLRYNWVATDRNGRVYAYVDEPHHDDYSWHSQLSFGDDDFAQVFDNINRDDGCEDWEDTLEARPLITCETPAELNTQYDWSLIPLRYNWVATDRNGIVYAYTYKPYTDDSSHHEWQIHGRGVDNVADFARIFDNIYRDDECEDWKDSLEARPLITCETKKELDLTKPLARSDVPGTYEYIREISTGYLLIHTSPGGRYTRSVIMDNLDSLKNADDCPPPEKVGSATIVVIDDIYNDRYIDKMIGDNPLLQMGDKLVAKLLVTYTESTGWTTTEIEL
jgi:hypothetical protein